LFDKGLKKLNGEQPGWFVPMNREQILVQQLETAADAYYNGGEAILGDEAYDTLRDELETLNPTHPFLKKVGAPPRGSTVPLPYLMASLTKIKPGTGTIEKFAETGTSFVLSDKLDGLSALWVTGNRKLYLRGDGEQGVDISSFVPYIQGLRSVNPCVVRGELITEGESRSWVNGILHQKEISVQDANRIRFIAYELLEPKGYKRAEQFTILEEFGFGVPWNDHVARSLVTEEKLSSIFKLRRSTNRYAIDGVVVGVNCIPLSQSNGVRTVTNPKDCVAFKMILEDQCAETTVRAILWSASHQGYLIPRLQVDPVKVQDCQIEFLTGHNAKLLQEKKLGLGAKIRIRRSGDVIPIVDTVLVPSQNIPFPPKYAWDSTQTHILIPLEHQGESVEIKTAKLLHFASTLEVANLGPGLVKKLVEAGYATPKALRTMTPEQWQTTLGKGMGEKVRVSFEHQMKTLTELKLMIASSTFPRGTGETKLKALFAKESDWMKWSIKILAGVSSWSYVALEECLTALEDYKKWRAEQFGTLVLDRSISPPPQVNATPPSLFVCFTGFRSTDLEGKCKAKNMEVQLSINKQTTVLVVSDSSNTESGKAKKARDMGIRILERNDFEKEYLGQA
jgi:DNA ligase (NAD+)